MRKMKSIKKKLLVISYLQKTEIEISRFKGLGEMPASQLKETTMCPEKRNLLKITIPSSHALEAQSINTNPKSRADVDRTVETLMGKKPELRFSYLQENARFVTSLDV